MEALVLFILYNFDHKNLNFLFSTIPDLLFAQNMNIWIKLTGWTMALSGQKEIIMKILIRPGKFNAGFVRQRRVKKMPSFV
jgi:hypothetical protein